MKIPEPPSIKAIQQFTPTLYDAALQCQARAAWIGLGNKHLLPQDPWSILGISFHRVLQSANKGLLPAEPEQRAIAARHIFDAETQKLYESAHPFVRTKYSSANRLPFYNLYRERAVVLSEESISRNALLPSTAPGRFANNHPLIVEETLSSQDDQLIGRPDLIERKSKSVIDYKTRTTSDLEMSDQELRQLRIYVYLGAENGIDIFSGVIVRGNGHRVEVPIEPTEAAQEAAMARELLNAFNAAAATKPEFHAMATPSAEHCKFCPCIPFCEAFWQQAQPSWAENCGTHVQGRLVEPASPIANSTELVTLTIEVNAGTLPPGTFIVEQVPRSWFTHDGSPLPTTADTVRIVNAWLVPSLSLTVLRINKMTSAIWTVPG